MGGDFKRFVFGGLRFADFENANSARNATSHDCRSLHFLLLNLPPVLEQTDIALPESRTRLHRDLI